MVRRLVQAEQAEQAEELEARQAARARESLFGDVQTRALLNSGVLAEQRGEWYSPREVLAGEAGRTPAEVIAYASAQMDLEDAQLAARLRNLGYRDPLSISEDFSADTSAPSFEARELDAERLQRGREIRKRRRETRQVAVASAHAVERGWA